MKSLASLFENPFLDAVIAHDSFKKFSEDHLGKLTANPGMPNGPIAALIASTGAAHLAYFGNIADIAVAKAVQQGMTKAVDDKIQQFIDLVRHEEPGVRYALGKDSPAYIEFFPHGITEYSEAAKANIETLMKQFAAAADAHSTDVKPNLSSAVGTIHTEYQALRSAQLGKKGTVSNERAERDAARIALASQLWKNALTIALAHPGDAAACMAYFDESIIKGSNSAKPAPNA